MTAPARIRQADIARALKAAKAAGLGDVRVEVEPNGKIVIMSGKLAEQGGTNPWDDEP